jgi:hypothetical protein
LANAFKQTEANQGQMRGAQKKMDTAVLTKQGKIEPNQDQVTVEMEVSQEKIKAETRSAQEEMRG